MTGEQFFSHSTAAALYGMPLPLAIGAALHVSVVLPAHPPQALGILGHRLGRAIEVRERGGLPLVAPAVAWCQLAGILDHRDLVIAGDFLVRRKRALASLEELAAAIRDAPPRGIRSLRRAYADIRPGTDSPRETVLRLLLVAAGLPEPVIGHAIRNDRGDFVGTPDLAYVDERIAIEYQGSDHWTKPEVFADDIQRRELIEAAGWQVIHVISRDLGLSAPLLVRRVKAALASRASV